MIPQFNYDTDNSLVCEALAEQGCAVITGLTNAEQRDQIKQQLAPHMADARVIDKDDPTQFYPGKTRRISALVALSEDVGNLVVHPHSKGVCDSLLLPNSEFGYHLHVTAALEVGPGARKQILHREEDSFTFFTTTKHFGA